MTEFKIYNLLLIFYILILIPACSKVRESAGVSRKSIDEFQVVESPPLVIPPDFSLVPPDQLQQKNIKNIENELAQEILFGLNNENTINEEPISTMNQILVEQGFKICNQWGDYNNSKLNEDSKLQIYDIALDNL